ncbi:MAG: hypothetical protein RLZZ63_1189 [Gemmatimonadota bacterium]|jgi:uncharacterized membrane protein YfcA
MTPLAAFLALAIGVVLGLVGGGGSILTQPILHHVVGLSTESAIVLGYPIVGITALIGAARHLRSGAITLRGTLPMGIAAMGGAWLGTRTVTWLGLSGETRFLLLAGMMVLAGTAMLRDVLRTHPLEPTEPHPAALIATGVVVGAITGIVGVGGGFLMVPALVVLGGQPMRQAVATSLLVISLSTALAFALQRRDAQVDWSIGLPFAALAVIGMLGSASLLQRIPQRPLKGVFALTLIIIGAFLALPSSR